MADRIVQPKVLASTNPDTYDNLIMQQAQNATNVTTNINGNAISDIFESNGIIVKKATNGIFMQSFSSLTALQSWLFQNINDLQILFFDINIIEMEPGFDVSGLQFTPSGTTSVSDQYSLTDLMFRMYLQKLFSNQFLFSGEIVDEAANYTSYLKLNINFSSSSITADLKVQTFRTDTVILESSIGPVSVAGNSSISCFYTNN